MADHRTDIEEHELPSLEAAFACTLALMTGYSQALQTELHPASRLAMGEKTAEHLARLAAQPQLSAAFRRVLAGLQARWQAMGDCTREAAASCAGFGLPGDAAGQRPRKALH